MASSAKLQEKSMWNVECKIDRNLLCRNILVLKIEKTANRGRMRRLTEKNRKTVLETNKIRHTRKHANTIIKYINDTNAKLNV